MMMKGQSVSDDDGDERGATEAAPRKYLPFGETVVKDMTSWATIVT